MPQAPIITLTTDFGGADGYLGAVKGVILSICPEANIVDIAHDIPPHDIVQAAMTLEAAVGYFPPGTVHLAVVDPGVGTNRRRILAQMETTYLVGPDNGILGLLFRRQSPQRIICIENEKFMLAGPATTFDGRDVFAPAAAYVANGLDPAELGPDIEDPVALDWPNNTRAKDELSGAVVTVDRFGNLITSIHREEIPKGVSAFAVRIKDQRIIGPAISYYDEGEKSTGAGFKVLFGSNGYLEIARPGSSAAGELSVQRGEIVNVCWSGTE